MINNLSKIFRVNWNKDDRQILLFEHPKRVLTIVIMVYVTCMLIASPIYLTFVRKSQMSFIYDTTSFIARTYQSASLLHSEMPGISEEVSRINRHWIEGFTIEDTRDGGEIFHFTFDARLNNAEIVERFNLGGNNFFIDLFDTFRFLALDRDTLVIIDNEEFEGVQKVYPIIKPAALTNWMYNIFQAINFYCLMVAIILTIVVWTYFNVMFNFSFRRWIEQLYGKKVAGQNLSSSKNTQEHFKQFISGENEMATLGKATQKLTHDFRNVLQVSNSLLTV